MSKKLTTVDLIVRTKLTTVSIVRIELTTVVPVVTE